MIAKGTELGAQFERERTIPEWAEYKIQVLKELGILKDRHGQAVESAIERILKACESEEEMTRKLKRVLTGEQSLKDFVIVYSSLHIDIVNEVVEYPCKTCRHYERGSGLCSMKTGGCSRWFDWFSHEWRKMQKMFGVERH